jgi:hypothetical protein
MRAVARARSAWVAALITGLWLLPLAAGAQQRLGQLTVPETEDESSSLPWRGSSFTWSQSLNVYALAQGAQLSYNPTYAWTFILQPRWYLNNRTYLSLDQRMSLELTDSDTTLYGRRAMLSDTIVGIDTLIYDLKLPRLGELDFLIGGGLVAPTSIASRAATMVLGARVRGGAQLTFEHVLEGASIGLQGLYTQRFLRHNTVEAEEPYPCLLSGTQVQNCTFLDGTTNVRNVISMIMTGTLELTRDIALELLVWLSWARGTGLAPASVTTASGMIVNVPDASSTHWRNDRYIVLGASWNAFEWLSLGLSMINYFPERSPDGSLRAFGKPMDLLVGLSASLSFDKLYLATRGQKPKNEPGQH